MIGPTETRHYPLGPYGDAELQALRAARPDDPTCWDCLPDFFKRPSTFKPIRSAADLPKIGETLPPNVIIR